MGLGSMSDANDPQLVVNGICHQCIHQTRAGFCEAFPEGIPVEILIGDFIHTRPFPGDGGITFERREGAVRGGIVSPPFIDTPE